MDRLEINTMAIDNPTIPQVSPPETADAAPATPDWSWLVKHCTQPLADQLRVERDWGEPWRTYLTTTLEMLRMAETYAQRDWVAASQRLQRTEPDLDLIAAAAHEREHLERLTWMIETIETRLALLVANDEK
jgi:hypothetical protein